MTLQTADTGFRQIVREQYRQGMAKIDTAIDLVIAWRRTQIDRPDEPVTPMDALNLLEAAVAVYAAKCGSLDRSSAASLILKAINRCLDTQEGREVTRETA